MQEVSFNTDIFTLSSIKKACYRQADKFIGIIESDISNKNIVTVKLDFLGNLTEREKKECVDMFHMDVVDYDLREKIYKESEVSRNLILAYAFSDSNGIMLHG